MIVSKNKQKTELSLCHTQDIEWLLSLGKVTGPTHRKPKK